MPISAPRRSYGSGRVARQLELARLLDERARHRRRVRGEIAARTSRDHRLQGMRRSGLALGDERVCRLERLVPAPEHEVHPDLVAADEPNARGVAVALGEPCRFSHRARPCARSRLRGWRRRRGCSRSCLRSASRWPARSPGPAPCRRCPTRVVESFFAIPIVVSACARSSSSPSSVAMASAVSARRRPSSTSCRDLADASREGEHACRRGRDRVACQLLGPREMRSRRGHARRDPRHAGEVRLGLGGARACRRPRAGRPVRLRELCC